MHCVKAEKECKCWLDHENVEITEEFAMNMTPRDRREIKRIFFECFEYRTGKGDGLQTKRGV